MKKLSKEAQKIKKNILKEFLIEDEGGLQILQTSLEAFDRMRECQKVIEKEGLTVKDRFGQIKAHPLCTVERDARSQFLLGLKRLNLDIEPLRDKLGRPGG
jgi:P27 family predicted phage terminase small subunit